MVLSLHIKKINLGFFCAGWAIFLVTDNEINAFIFLLYEFMKWFFDKTIDLLKEEPNKLSNRRQKRSNSFSMF